MKKHVGWFVIAALAAWAMATPVQAKCPRTGCPQQAPQQAPRQAQPRPIVQQPQRTFQPRNTFQPQTSVPGRSYQTQNPFQARTNLPGSANTKGNPFQTGVNPRSTNANGNPFQAGVNPRSTNTKGNPFQAGVNPRSTNANGNPFRTGSNPGGTVGSLKTGPSEANRAQPLGQGSVRTAPPMQARMANRVSIDSTTTVVAHQNGRGLTVSHQNPDGSQVVAKWRTLSNGRRQVDAYKLTKDTRTGVQTRQYLDGRKVTVGKDFVTRSVPRHLTITTHSNGLREASLPNGKPVFRERFGTKTDKDGYPEKTIVRTVFARVDGGKAYPLQAPVTQVYEVVDYGDVVIYPYYPWDVPIAFYDPFFYPFAAIWPLAMICPGCLPPDVYFDGPPESYSDPADLLGDMQVSSGFDEGINGAPDDVGPADAPVDSNTAPIDVGNEPPAADTTELANEVDQLQDQVATAETKNPNLRNQLSDQQTQIGMLHGKADATDKSGARGSKTRVKVPANVRAQVRKQVKEDIQLEKAQQPLSLVDVVASAEAQSYVFQIGDMIDATEVNSGEECGLTMGDLARFNQLPGEGSPTAQMKVVTSKPDSCRAGAVVEVSMGDLQRMLNAFSQRLEKNMKKAHDQIAQAARTQSPKKG